MDMLMPAEDYDAVLFHMYYFWLSPLPLPTKGTLPARRSPHQRYIFFILEAPPMAGISFRYTGGLFNWTMTYRQDSDIAWPYAEFVPLGDTPAPARGWLPAPAAPIAPSAAAALESVDPSRHEGDKVLVAWLVSNCHTQSRREHYVRELSKHIRVDVYGKCAARPWPKDDVEGFYRTLSANYTFYLSFENSLC
ncbi:Alpha-(1,3)-fucosyltransferase C, partial [Gryllus bimaculatus]